MSLTPEERREALQAVIAMTKQTTRSLEVVCRLLEASGPADERPTEQEQEILNLWDDLEDGAKLTTAAIAKMLDNYGDNGTLKRRLAEMVRKHLLINHHPGYSPHK